MGAKKRTADLKILNISFMLGMILLRPLKSGFPPECRRFLFRECCGCWIWISIVNFMKADLNVNLKVRLLHFLVSLPDTVFWLCGTCWQVCLMMCWKAKWRKGMTHLWWQKQSGDSNACPILLYPLHPLPMEGKNSWKTQGYRKRREVREMQI